MSSIARILVAVLVLAGPSAAATVPALCQPGRLDSVRLDARAGRARVRARVRLPPAVDPTVTLLVVRLAGAVEADQAGDLLEVALPAGDGWERDRRGFTYRPAAPAAAGVSRLKLRRGRGGAARLVFEAMGLRLEGGVPPRLHLAVATGGACARTCAATCAQGRSGRVRCRRSRDTALCGLMSGCEPLGASAGALRTHCLAPYPSDAFTAPDPEAATGRRMAYPRRAMPANRDGVHIDPAAWNTLDGFSPGPVITAHFAQGVDLAASRVPPLTDPAASLAADAPTLVIEADTPGCVRVPHFGENDVSAALDGRPVAPPAQALLVRPLRRLRNATRYVVALRGLVGQDGRPLAAPEGFARARRGKTGSAALDAQRARVRRVLEKLERDCGVAPDDVLLAWDFTTGSDDRLQRWLLHMRDMTLGALGDAAPPFTVGSVEDDPLGDPQICRRVRGRFTVPLWTEFDGPGARLAIDPATGLPRQTGLATGVPFTVLVPCSLVGPPAAAGRIIVYGHGLLGAGDSELAGGRDLRRLADRHGFILVATDWQGMARDDIATIVGFIPDLSGFPVLPERLHQGILNQLVLAHLAASADGLVTAPALRGAGGTPLLDPTQVYFYGNSMGGIYGGTFMALATRVTRGVLGVGAANFSTVLQRSAAFGAYSALLRPAYPDDLDRALGYPIIQQVWDRVDPNGWHHRIIDDPLPETPPHTVLLHLATNDAEVPTLGLEIMARSLGIPQLGPAVRSIWEVPVVTAPWDGSALVESDGGYPPVPLTTNPPPPNGAHEGMRALPAIQAQIDAFLRPGGRVEQFCDGPCDPE